MIQIKDFTPRRYQQSILQVCKEKNTLVCLPTGTGKTKIAVLLGIERLNKIEDSKILICSPTKPLTNQIKEEFQNATTLDSKKINVLTGEIAPGERKNIWENSRIIVATPQTIENDLDNKSFDLKQVSLLCIDECHRSKMHFANTMVAKIYGEQAMHPRILALTASPGSTKENLEEVCKNLLIEAVEIRTEEDEDIREHIQGKSIEIMKVELPQEFKEIRDQLKKVYLQKGEALRSFGLTKPFSIVNKKDLLAMQAQLHQQIRNNSRSAFVGISLVAQAIKLSYLIELVETQSMNTARLYLEKLKKETSKAAKNILGSRECQEAEKKINELVEKGVKHPKLEKIKEIVEKELAGQAGKKIIIFANLRNTVDEIVELLNKEGVKAKKFVGQANKEGKGLKQKEQIEIIQEFKSGTFNVLVASSVGEEGLDIPEVNLVVFYEPVASELRRIQRSGRTGRTKPGKVIYLMAKGTRDEAYHWVSQKKQKKMNEMLYDLKEKQEELV
jgi:Fanconi anemia group M protein